MMKGYLMASYDVKQNKTTEKTNQGRDENYTELLTYQKGDIDMAGIKVRKNGLFEVRKMINGSSKSIYTRNYAKAQKILFALDNHKIKIEKQEEKQKEYTVKQWFTEWMETYKKPFIKPNTYKETSQAVNKIIKAFGNVCLSKLNPTKIQSFLNTYERTRTKEKLALYFNAGLQKASDINLMQKNIFNAIIRDKKIKNKKFAYTFAEQQKIIQAINGSDIEHEIYLYLLSGCRPSELPTSISQFDFENNLLHIYGTKNEKSKHRIIEMSKQFADFIKSYLQTNAIKQHGYVSSRFAVICETLHIDSISIYRLRHTFASNHFVLETQAKQVQEWLGHTNISMTLDVYTDIDKTCSKEKIEKLYNYFYYVK